ncbi:MAG: SUMF1/EgtB/PvdO family nonheme iron enzyme [Gloeomargarita sp. DG02_5_bins_242]
MLEQAGLQHLEHLYRQVRQRTIALVEPLPPAQLYQQVHPELSPLGWHFGHIAYTEALWLLGEPLPYPELNRIFRVDGYAKAQRAAVLPPPGLLQEYVHGIREKVLAVLPTLAPERERLWYWVIQHEMQHQETMTVIRTLQGTLLPSLAEMATHSTTLNIPGGVVRCGSEAVNALDNERPGYPQEVAGFQIRATPVTQGEFAEFIAAGGYQDPRWWSQAGWQWLQRENVTQPLYWQSQYQNRPVCGISYYEASAYCRFIGKRLPRESEWEWAAQQGLPQRGQVWEWTSSWFSPYPNFTPYPYTGYSASYFDCQHKVMRGGSWATHDELKRPSFRNWYQPHIRQMFTGLRWVAD